MGHHHPLTALGMSLGFQDAMAIANASSFAAYRKERMNKTRVPEMLAVALYEVFADTHDEVIDTRPAIYDLWRESPVERSRPMRFLACQETSPLLFGNSFVKAMAIAARKLVSHGASTSQWSHVRSITELGSRIRWLLGGSFHLTEQRPSKELPRAAEEKYAGAVRAAQVRADVVELPSAAGHAARTGQDRWDPARALERGIRSLEALQDDDGSWEGEVVLCPLLAAEYVVAWWMMGRPIAEDRKRRLLLHFERSRHADGIAWYSGYVYEQFALFNRALGPYWWSYFGMMFCNVVSPQFFWKKSWRRNLTLTFFLSIVVNIGMWFERFVIIATTLARDYLPSSWSLYSPTWVEIGIFVGTMGLFFTCYLIFARVAPVVAVAEIKHILKTGGNQYVGENAVHHHSDHEEHSEQGHH